MFAKVQIMTFGKISFLITVIILIITSFAHAQDEETLLLEEIRNAYNQLNYTEASIKANSALDHYERFTPAQLTEIHKILALIYYSQNNTVEARKHFESALDLTPDLELDPLFISPKILNFFDQIKKERGQKLKQSSNASTEVRYVLVEDRRPSAALRSMILPGWGQLYKGDNTKGKVLIALWSAGLIGSVATHLARQNAEDKYLSETDPEKIQSRFNTFNTFHKIRNNLILFSAGVWIYSYIDAILKEVRPRKVEVSHSEKTFFIFPSISSNYAYINFIVNF